MFKRSHRQEFRVTAFAVLALFIAQFGALAHAYSHHPVDAKAAAVEASGDRQGSNSQENCGECLNFAPLLSAAGAPAVLPLSLQVFQSPAAPAPPASLLPHRAYLAFRSRAPPAIR